MEGTARSMTTELGAVPFASSVSVAHHVDVLGFFCRHSREMAAARRKF